MLAIVLLILGFVLLIRGAGWLVDGAVAFAKKFGVSDLVVGLTVVAFGTSLPELAVSFIAGVQGDSTLAVANITGSNIANILLILGVSSLVFPLSVGKGTVWKEIPLSLLAAVMLAVLLMDMWLGAGGKAILSRADGLVLLAFFAVFIYYSASIARDIPEVPAKEASHQSTKKRIMLFTALGLVMLVVGGKAAVAGAVGLARWAGLSEVFIGVTIVAVGTSLPELFTSVVAAFRKNPDIAVGNVVGSNIFNIFFILGISATARPLEIGPGLSSSIIMAIVSSFVLFVCMFTGTKSRIDRWEGVLMLVMYAAYVFMEFGT